MKYFYIFFLLLALLFSNIVFAENTTPTNPVVSNCHINTTLRVGSVGEEVKCLQSIVGTTPDGHFGPKTKAAVVFWQSARGLSPDGVVGSLTRAALSRVFAASGGLPEGCTSAVGYSSTTGKKCDNSGTTTGVTNSSSLSASGPTPLLIPGTNIDAGGKEPESLKNADQNLELYISAVKTNLLKNNISSDKISFIEDKIRKTTKENSNALQQFFDDQKAIYGKVSEKISTPTIGMFFKKMFSFVERFVSPNEALAASLAPFGGFVTYSNPAICDCPPGVFTQIFIALPSASPPISNIYLDYLNGSQAFLNYNMPEPSIAALGFYTPGTVSCYTYVGEACVSIPSYGLITPTVGSSLAP